MKFWKDMLVKIRKIIPGQTGKLIPTVAIPKFVFVSEDIKEEVLKVYPTSELVLSEDKHGTDVVFIVSNNTKNYVNELGVMYVNKNTFLLKVFPALLEMIKGYEKGSNVSDYLKSFINTISGEFKNDPRFN